MIQGQLPNLRDWNRLEPIFKKYGFSPKPANANSYYVTGYSCDCGTALGSNVRNADLEKHHRSKFEQQLQQHRKAGWSEARIDRWLAEVSKLPNQMRRAEGDELKAWFGLIRDLIFEGKISFVRLRVYDAGAADSALNGPEPRKVALESTAPEVLAGMADGRWYEFTQKVLEVLPKPSAVIRRSGISPV